MNINEDMWEDVRSQLEAEIRDRGYSADEEEEMLDALETYCDTMEDARKEGWNTPDELDVWLYNNFMINTDAEELDYEIVQYLEGSDVDPVELEASVLDCIRYHIGTNLGL